MNRRNGKGTGGTRFTCTANVAAEIPKSIDS